MNVDEKNKLKRLSRMSYNQIKDEER